jgi:hypothetical protein
MTTTIDRNIQRRSLIALLKKHECKIVFTKADGTARELRCTLNQDQIPQAINGEVGGDDREVVKVWDLEKNAWRSFRMDSLRRGCRVIS